MDEWPSCWYSFKGVIQDCAQLCCVPHIYQWYQLGKKGWGVCCHVYVIGPHTRTCVDHWNMPNHHTSTYQIWVCKCVKCVNACLWKQIEGGTALQEVLVLYVPQAVDLGGGGSSSIERNDKERSWALPRMNWSL